MWCTKAPPNQLCATVQPWPTNRVCQFECQGIHAVSTTCIGPLDHWPLGAGMHVQFLLGASKKWCCGCPHGLGQPWLWAGLAHSAMGPLLGAKIGTINTHTKQLVCWRAGPLAGAVCTMLAMLARTCRGQSLRHVPAMLRTSTRCPGTTIGTAACSGTSTCTASAIF